MTRLHTLLLAALASVALLAGCFEVRENSDPIGDEVNNAGEGSADYDEDPDCIASTTGEPTSEPSANPCPQGQIPDQ